MRTPSSPRTAPSSWGSRKGPGERLSDPVSHLHVKQPIMLEKRAIDGEDAENSSAFEYLFALVCNLSSATTLKVD